VIAIFWAGFGNVFQPLLRFAFVESIIQGAFSRLPWWLSGRLTVYVGTQTDDRDLYALVQIPSERVHEIPRRVACLVFSEHSSNELPLGRSPNWLRVHDFFLNQIHDLNLAESFSFPISSLISRRTAACYELFRNALDSRKWTVDAIYVDLIPSQIQCEDSYRHEVSEKSFELRHVSDQYLIEETGCEQYQRDLSDCKHEPRESDFARNLC
jgi:hypothetical protein